jgi:hypothetical protein
MARYGQRWGLATTWLISVRTYRRTATALVAAAFLMGISSLMPYGAIADFSCLALPSVHCPAIEVMFFNQLDEPMRVDVLSMRSSRELVQGVYVIQSKGFNNVAMQGQGIGVRFRVGDLDSGRVLLERMVIWERFDSVFQSLPGDSPRYKFEIGVPPCVSTFTMWSSRSRAGDSLSSPLYCVQ